MSEELLILKKITIKFVFYSNKSWQMYENVYTHAPATKQEDISKECSAQLLTSWACTRFNVITYQRPSWCPFLRIVLSIFIWVSYVCCALFYFVFPFIDVSLWFPLVSSNYRTLTTTYKVLEETDSFFHLWTYDVHYQKIRTIFINCFHMLMSLFLANKV